MVPLCRQYHYTCLSLSADPICTHRCTERNIYINPAMNATLHCLAILVFHSFEALCMQGLNVEGHLQASYGSGYIKIRVTVRVRAGVSTISRSGSTIIYNTPNYDITFGDSKGQA